MYQFTTTTVVNSLYDVFNTVDPTLPLYSAQEAEGERPASFYAKHVNNFKEPNIVAIYKSPYVAPRLSYAEIDLTKSNFPVKQQPETGDHLRFSIYIRLDQSSQSSYYSNDMVFKGKPLSVEFIWQGNAATTAKYLENIIKKYEIAVYEKPIIKVKADGNKLIITATDQYQRFHSVEVETYDAEAYHGMGEYKKALKALPEKIGNGQGDYVTNTDPDFNPKHFIRQGIEGFGTYEWLLHNLRLPTTARTRIYAMNSDETPIPGAHYDEFVIHYCVNRGILGNNAVGDLVKSMTTHVFYVNHNVVGQFEEILKKVVTDDEKWHVVMSDYVKKVITKDSNPNTEHGDLDNAEIEN